MQLPVTATGDGAPDGAGRSSDAGRTLTECLLRHLVRRTEMSASSAILQSLWKMSAAYQKSRFLRCKMSLIVAGMAKRRRTAVTTLDQISLGFVAVCAIGIAYLILVEPIRQRLPDDRGKKKKSKH